MFKKVLIFVGVAVLALGVAAIALAQQPASKKVQTLQSTKQQHVRPDWWNDAGVRKDLMLTSDQISKLQNAWNNFDKSRNTVRAELWKARQEIEAAFKAQAIDPQKISVLAAKIADSEGKIIKNRIGYRLTVMQILTYQQRQQIGTTFKTRGVATDDPTSPAGIIFGEVE